MKALAIDTSTFVMGVAIVDGQTIVGETITNIKKNHSIRLMPAITDLLKEVGVKPKDLDRVIVAEGPGSYTGVRIGVTTAKTLAWSLGIPIVGVSSLEVMAQNGRGFSGFISPLIDARRGQVYTGLYQANQELEVAQKLPDTLVLLEDWLSMVKDKEERVLFLGNDVVSHEQMIKDILGEKAVLEIPSMSNPRPSELASIGLKKEPHADVHQFVPTYLQLAEAEANWLQSQKVQGEQK
ncbi:tRNA (adenosine(37)-N6)-threonylcarbamoyltransferase complex dimerization subunit type 1 TsaB [Bacillus alkalicellulosilyticus]|uniref:tRNA (adenosine(37)-N6)-threonylcarbamoyltransferase complex dimerization subunit type 1 TsaB n=1 Tax=Alkalihalobacterium alkalicellulosilyticum TaxID=1912214 RepID=UPI000998BBBB|nr:tRNA (adenosine(37)-N6)-threonylcarbamoyltransferase complex dimerization subunit type 1 TsaB [Bacillus alkalicellulosilyticus]